MFKNTTDSALWALSYRLRESLADTGSELHKLGVSKIKIKGKWYHQFVK